MSAAMCKRRRRRLLSIDNVGRLVRLVADDPGRSPRRARPERLYLAQSFSAADQTPPFTSSRTHVGT